MKNYSFPASILLSFGSTNFYRDVKNNWTGTGFLHLFGTTLIIGVVIFAILYSHLTTLQSEESLKALGKNISQLLDPEGTFSAEEQVTRLLQIIEQIPPITVNDGIVSADIKMPYFIYDPITMKSLAIIDTTGTITSLRDRDEFMLITSDTVIVSENEDNERVIYIDSQSVDKEKRINIALSYIAQLPKITIKNGLASMDRQSPYIIYRENSQNRPEIIFDMSSDIDTSSPLHKDAVIVLTDKYLYIPSDKDADNYTEDGKITLTELNNENMTNILLFIVPKIIIYMKNSILPVAILAITILGFGIILIITLFISLIGTITSNLMKITLNYDDILRLSAISMTPFVIFYPLFQVLSLTHSDMVFLPPNALFVVCVGYIILAVASNKNNVKKF